MRMKKLEKSILCYLTGCMTIGVLFSFGVSQFLWLVSADNRIDSYANVVLNHAEMVAGNLTTALDELNTTPHESCGPSDLDALKRVTYEYRFVKDAGRIENKAINCSAMWGVIPDFRLTGESRVTQNNVQLWGGVSSYFPSAVKIDISAKGNSFVVTSPTAFAPFESPPVELSSSVVSRDGKTIMRTFGEFHQGNMLTSAFAKLCSEKYDICVVSNIDANIFTTNKPGLLLFIALIGCSLGLLAFYAAHQYRRVRDSLSHRLKYAIKNGTISTAYQPIVHGMTGKVSGFEVLARWHDKKFGSVPPNVFIEKAEDLGLQEKLNKLIVNKALEECSKGLACNPEVYLSFNIETKDLLGGGLVRHISDTARKHGILAGQIAIEMLEGATADISKIEGRIESLRAYGHKVLIDDFGSGYSSLSYLARLNVDVIKIDKSFSQAAGTGSPAEIVLQKIYEIAKAMNAQIVFEGVETEAQKIAILEFCPDALIQGWLFSKALPITELIERVKSQTARGKAMNFAHD
jgi:sensor c-di-GMP phosphodiesterase-like protein